MAATEPKPDRTAAAPKARLLLFASGDFAFNLFWQSSMLFLLFYYTDVLGIPIAVAATIFTIGAVWDGFASLAAGLIIERRPDLLRPGLLRVGGIPLGIAFVIAYLPPPTSGSLGLSVLLVTHLLFRSAYAAVNVPYLAMSARISQRSQDRAFVSGTRMLFGTAAAVVVALGTVPLGGWASGATGTTGAFVVAALSLASVGAAILVSVGNLTLHDVPAAAPAPASIQSAFISLARNKAFVSLAAAMTTMVIGATLLNKSVLYVFKYAHAAPDGGQLALASMAMVSVIAIPCWMLLARKWGLRWTWIAAALGAATTLLVFATTGIGQSGNPTLFLMSVQAMLMGLNFVFWAMLPNTIEYGDQRTGVHIEGIVFGVASLLQRLGIGIGTALLGWTLGSAGYVANQAASEATLEALRWSASLTPLIFLALSCVAMLLNPLARGTHAAIVRELGKERLKSG